MRFLSGPIPARPLWRGHFLSGPWLGQGQGAAVRCCPNPNAPPGQEMPCYDAQGKLLYYTDSKHSYGECAMPTAPPPAGNGSAPAASPSSGAPPSSTMAPEDKLPNVITQNPPAKVTFPIANLSFPGGMEEPPLQQFIHLPSGATAAPRPATVYPAPERAAQVLPQPPGTVVQLKDYFKPSA